MKNQGGGNIVNITISRNRGARDKFSYVVAKGGSERLDDVCPNSILRLSISGVNAGGYRTQRGSPVGSKENPERDQGA